MASRTFTENTEWAGKRYEYRYAISRGEALLSPFQIFHLCPFCTFLVDWTFAYTVGQGRSVNVLSPYPRVEITFTYLCKLSPQEKQENQRGNGKVITQLTYDLTSIQTPPHERPPSSVLLSFPVLVPSSISLLSYLSYLPRWLSCPNEEREKKWKAGRKGG